MYKRQIDNSSLKGRESSFITIELDIAKIVKDWKASVFSFEWLTPEGQVRTLDVLGETQTEQYQKVETAFKCGETLERPVLGLGVMDNIEIGSRKEVLLTLCALGVEKIDVHVPKSCLKDFQKFI